MVLVPGAETAHGSLRLDSCGSAAGPVLSLLLSSLLFLRRCSLVVAAAPVVGAAPVAAPVVPAAPDADPIAAPLAASVTASVADPVADVASPLRVP